MVVEFVDNDNMKCNKIQKNVITRRDLRDCAIIIWKGVAFILSLCKGSFKLVFAQWEGGYDISQPPL